MSAYLPATALPRSTSTPVIMGQYDAVDGVGIPPLVLLGMGAMSLIGGSAFWAGRSSAAAAPAPTFGSAVGSEIGSAVKWLVLAGVAYAVLGGKLPKLGGSK